MPLIGLGMLRRSWRPPKEQVKDGDFERGKSQRRSFHFFGGRHKDIPEIAVSPSLTRNPTCVWLAWPFVLPGKYVRVTPFHNSPSRLCSVKTALPL
ncbi:hypothetical protein L596_017574 [Steinernema carpocapsae]|uniref:Uncharacterized protein n=1 Tax=Steinernema carpocapsae TaxID=34508 RepID=A0A4U5N229_STECR|nr:hypothetical protein L596_017574 [Steinernema carpocapsae]